MSVNPIPQGCNSVNVYLIVKDARAAMDFYAKAFGGNSGACMTAPDGSVMHGEVTIGNSTVMLSQENPAWGMSSPESLGGSPASMHLYVENVDQSFDQAIAAGCQVVAPVENMFWGDRYGKVLDPFGFQWGIATHLEDVEPDEMQRRSEAWMASMAQAESCDSADAAETL